MDPDAVLAEMRAAIAKRERFAEGGSNDAEIDNYAEIADAAEALDEWLTKGGLLPSAWRRVPDFTDGFTDEQMAAHNEAMENDPAYRDAVHYERN